MTAPAGWLCVGVVGKPKGVRGAVRITTYTERPEDIAAYGPLHDGPGGRALEIVVREVVRGGVVAEIAGVADRNAAEALRGSRLYVPRSALPEPEAEEYYHADLIGLAAVDAGGRRLGRVVAIHDFGAGDLVEIADGGAEILVPLSRECVPEIDLAGGRMVVVPPAEGGDNENDERAER